MTYLLFRPMTFLSKTNQILIHRTDEDHWSKYFIFTSKASKNKNLDSRFIRNKKQQRKLELVKPSHEIRKRTQDYNVR